MCEGDVQKKGEREGGCMERMERSKRGREEREVEEHRFTPTGACPHNHQRIHKHLYFKMFEWVIVNQMLLMFRLVKSHKKVFSMKTSTCRDGTLKNQPNKIGTTFTPSLHLVNIIMWLFSHLACKEVYHIIIFISQLFGLYFAGSTQTAVNTNILLRDYI